MNLLAIDTSTERGSVTLLVGGELGLNEVFSADRSHSATLFTVIERARALVDRVDIVAVGLGPGSYAGIRIAVAAAIGFQVGLGCRIVGLPSVVALETAEPRYCAVGDARRDAFYFTRVEEGRCVDGPRLVSADELHALETEFSALPFFAPAPLPASARATVALPLARNLAHWAAAGIGIVAEGALEPLYLRDPHITQPKVR